MSAAGLVPALGLAGRAGLEQLAQQRLTVPGGPGTAAGAKVSALVAGMLTGVDSIADLDVLRHGATARLVGGVRTPSTLGTFLPWLPVRPCPAAGGLSGCLCKGLTW